jgi:hypothetical protein
VADKAGAGESEGGVSNEPEYKCPDCDYPLDLCAGDGPPSQDRWSCVSCGVEFPHSRFPLPPGYVAAARKVEESIFRRWREEDEQRKLAAWNTGRPIR